MSAEDVVAARREALKKFTVEPFDPQAIARPNKPIARERPVVVHSVMGGPQIHGPFDSQMATAKLPTADSGGAPAQATGVSKGLDDLAKALEKAERCCGVTWSGGGLKGCPKCKTAFASE